MVRRALWSTAKSTEGPTKRKQNHGGIRSTVLLHLPQCTGRQVGHKRSMMWGIDLGPSVSAKPDARTIVIELIHLARRENLLPQGMRKWGMRLSLRV